MILCVGPTGSGKTTTLHSALATSTRRAQDLTAEDPIEITQAGCARCSQSAHRLDFAQGPARLPGAPTPTSSCREVADKDTAQVAVEAR